MIKYIIVFALIAVVAIFFLGQNTQSESGNFITKIFNGVKNGLKIIDGWLGNIFGINFSTIFRFIADAIIWAMELVISIFKWIVGLVL